LVDLTNNRRHVEYFMKTFEKSSVNKFNTKTMRLIGIRSGIKNNLSIKSDFLVYVRYTIPNDFLENNELESMYVNQLGLYSKELGKKYEYLLYLPIVLTTQILDEKIPKNY